MPPENVDVNVHPTKKEVHFLHEDELLQLIRSIIEPALNASNQSRTFGAQPSLAHFYLSSSSSTNNADNGLNSGTSGEGAARLVSSSSKPTVRADSSLQKLETFFKPSSSSGGAAVHSFSRPSESATTAVASNASSVPVSGCACCTDSMFCMEVRKRKIGTTLESHSTDGAEQLRCDLDSVRGLLRDVDQQCDSSLRSLFTGLVFVGVIDACHSLVQLDSKLMVVNHSQALRQLCYQMVLIRFGGLAQRALDPPVSVSQFIEASLDPQDMMVFADAPKETVASTAVSVLLDHNELLSDYFSISLNERGQLSSLPELFPGLIPSLDFLPFFLRDLAMETEWTDESSCIKSIAQLLAKLYTSKPMELPPEMTQHRALESVFYPLMRKHLKPSKEEALTCFAVTDLNNLYKVFERC